MGILHNRAAHEGGDESPRFPLGYIGHRTRSDRYTQDAELENFRAGRPYGLVPCRELARQLTAGAFRTRIGPRGGVHRERDTAPVRAVPRDDAVDLVRMFEEQERARARRNPRWI